MLTDTEKDNYINSKFIPKPQIILNKKPVNLPLTKSVKSMINNITGALNISLLISINKSKSWLYFDDSWKIFSFLNSPPKEINLENSFEWQNWFDSMNNKDIENIKLLGLTQHQLSSGEIAQEQWDNILPYDNYNKSIVFLSLMYTDSYDIVETNKISIIQDMYNYYKENKNFIQRQKTNQLVIIPQFNSQQIKINYIL